ncbi:mitochondrial assembly of ribosomal large subunit protein 1 [Anthonomus grandis grandis]|uniref:mitochondrial assembly of ribosomal large subunit protein 1 n=1 Tax=Anthonomus grandis grandis TaxID=2921223 RepID=UPI0021661E62|nr:mitochondrial assembly of ribosomal large subunit protein 1 [Anthonomus grandis grandis]
MIAYSVLRSLTRQRFFTACRSLSKKTTNDLSTNTNSDTTSYESTHQHIAPQDEEEEILDVYRERLKYSPILEQEEVEIEDRFRGLNLNHGLFGVFDIEDLVETLQQQNGEDVFVASVPKDIKYVDYIVVVSGRSHRHMQGIAQTVRRLYKIKRYSSDIIPKLEGETSPDWMAMDLGNIALHIFSKKARSLYDLDSLWAVGSKYDEEFNKKEPISNLLENYSLGSLEPAK